MLYIPNILKRCTKCGLPKLPDEFHLDKHSPDGRTYQCKECRDAKRREYYTQNSSQEKAKHTDWARKNPTKNRAIARADYWRHREAHRARNSTWSRANRDFLRGYEQRYRDEHPEYDTARKHRRRARKAKASGQHFTAEEWRDLKARYDNTCLCCHRSEPEIKLTPDHVIPLASGGSDEITNIQPLCHSCNSRKGKKTADYRP